MSKTSSPPFAAPSVRPRPTASRHLVAPDNLTVVHSAPVWLPQTQTWMHSQATCLPSWIDNHIVCDTTQNLEQFDLPNIHALAAGSRAYRLWDRLLRYVHVREHFGHLPRVLRQSGARVLHSHFGHIGWTNYRLAAELGVAHVVTFYGQDVTFLPKNDPAWVHRYRCMFQTAARVLCEGPHMAQAVVDLGCPADQVQVHHLGVNTAGFRFEQRRYDPQGSAALRVLLAGAFTEKKGLPDAIRALAILGEQVPIEVTVVGDAVAGNHRHETEKAAILAAVHRNKMTDRVRFLGFQSHAKLIDEAYGHHIFLSPSRHAADGDSEGGAPVSILELAATGMPVVSTTHCDIPEVIPNETCGLLAEEGDVDGIAERLLRLAQAPDSWATMTKAARAHIEAQYDQDLQGEALAEIYRLAAGGWQP